MTKLLKRKIRFLKNWFKTLKSSPYLTIKFTLKTILIKRFYNTFSWVIGFLIFSPALFDEHPLERIRDILKWLKENFILTCFHITNMLRNKFADILNYFGFKTGQPKDSWFGSLNPFSGDSPPKKPPLEPNFPKPDYEAMLKKYDQEWKNRMRQDYPADNGPRLPLDLSNPYHWLYASLVTVSLAVTTSYVWYNWETFAPFFQSLNFPAVALPTISTIYTSGRDYIKTIYEIWVNVWPRRSANPISQITDDQIDGPQEIILNDERTDTKGKGKATTDIADTKGKATAETDIASTMRKLSNEDMANINPHSEAAAHHHASSSQPSSSAKSSVAAETGVKGLSLNLFDSSSRSKSPLFSVHDSDTSSSGSSARSPILDQIKPQASPSGRSPILEQIKPFNSFENNTPPATPEGAAKGLNESGSESDDESTVGKKNTY